MFKASTNSLAVAKHPLSRFGVHVVHAATVAACVIAERESPQLILNSTCSPKVGSSHSSREIHENHHRGSEDKCNHLLYGFRLKVLEQNDLRLSILAQTNKLSFQSMAG